MIFENLYKILFQNRKKLFYTVSYILILIALLSTYLFSSIRSAHAWVRNDMQKKLDSFLLSADAEFNERTGYAMSLSENNLLRMPLNLSIYGQLKDYLNNDGRIEKGGYKFIITDRKDSIIFNNTSYLKNLSGIQMLDTSYTAYIYNNGIHKIFYLPVFYENTALNEPKERIGAIITAYNFFDFHSLMEKQTKDISYTYYGYVYRYLSLILSGKSIQLNKPINPDSYAKLKEGFVFINISGNNTLTLNKYIELKNMEQPFILSLAIRPADVRLVEFRHILSGLSSFLLTSLIITIILYFTNYILRKDFSNKLEIQNLQIQRHDFSKHLGIIRGMVVLDEYEELKQYLEELNEKVQLTGVLSKLGRYHPLSVLIEEMESRAREKNIVFKIDIAACLDNVKVSPSDLCTIAGNLIDNAIEACSVSDIPGKEVEIEISRKDNYCDMKISNTGSTIPEKDLGKIFRPGYTTKEGSDRGFGLYIVSKTLRKYHSTINVQSSNGKTSFTVFLPVRSP
jgi:two-component system sensor histidine kinase AgrC